MNFDKFLLKRLAEWKRGSPQWNRPRTKSSNDAPEPLTARTALECSTTIERADYLGIDMIG
jgi:hypothetical protein